MRTTGMFLALAMALALAACSKPMVGGRVSPELRYYSQDYAASANDLYYAVRWALKEAGYPVENEDLAGGVITTKWLPVTADSHYVAMFGQQDYGVTNSYHQLDVKISPSSGRTKVEVASRVKAVAHNVKSSGVEEKKVLSYVGNYLRGAEPDLSNLGIRE